MLVAKLKFEGVSITYVPKAVQPAEYQVDWAWLYVVVPLHSGAEPESNNASHHAICEQNEFPISTSWC